MEFRDHDRDANYFLAGFPCEWNPAILNTGSVPCEYFALLTRAYKGKLNTSTYDLRFHLLLGVSRSTTKQLQGNSRQLPDSLVGISGASVWVTHHERNHGQLWTPEHARVVAVETRVYGDAHEVVRATHIGAILRLVFDVYTDLRPVLRFHMPGI
jgi:hypothetical protein